MGGRMTSRKPAALRGKAQVRAAPSRAGAQRATPGLTLAMDRFKHSPRQGREALRELVRTTQTFRARNELLSEVRRKKNPAARRAMVRAYVDLGRKPELVTSLALMNSRDAVPFLGDFFRVGGTTRDLANWLAHVSQRYVTVKHHRGVDTARGGLTVLGLPDFSELWDDVVNAAEEMGRSLREAITSLVSTFVMSGRSFGDLLNDVLDFPQRILAFVVEAWIDAGKTVADIVDGVLEKADELMAQGPDALEAVMHRVFKAIKTAFKALGLTVLLAVTEILEALVEDGVQLLFEAVKVLIKIGGRIKNVLNAALKIGLDIFGAVIGFLVDLGRSVIYILTWALGQAVTVLGEAMKHLLALGRPLAMLVGWAIARGTRIALLALKQLIRLGKTPFQIAVILLTRPGTILSRGIPLLRQLGASYVELLAAAAWLGPEALMRLAKTFWALGVELADILAWAATKSDEVFKKVVTWLLGAGVLVFDIVVWAASRSFQILGKTLEAIDALVDTFLDLLEWAAVLQPPWLDSFARWFAQKARGAVEWFENKVVAAALAAGKLAVLIAIAAANILFLAVVVYVFKKSLVDDAKTDFRHWPATFAEFKQQMGPKIAILPPTDDLTRYVIVSDAHKESGADVSAGIGHFYKNTELFRRVLSRYADEGWTLVALGDDEEFWFSGDLDTEADPVDKVDDIVAANASVYEDLSTRYYKNRLPRRFVKIRGNHDDVWREGAAVNALEKHGFPNLEIPEFAVIRQGAREFLLLHGHQFDAYNCDANNFFGKFASNFAAESVDQLNDILVDFFGASARIEGWAVAPFSVRSEWEKKIRDEVTSPEIAADIMFDERRIVDQADKYQCSVVAGHTHNPKLMQDGARAGRCYVNAGTAGWWEGCVWTVEIGGTDVFLKAWTSDAPEPYFSQKLGNDTKSWG